ncbi:MAG: PmbA/TldD protein, partial [Elusimicrobia bacterium]
EGTQCGVSVAATAERDGEIQVGSAGASTRAYAELDFAQVGRDAAFRAGSLLGSRKLPTGRRAVLFDPWVSGELLELVSGLLSADEVQRGKSLLRGKLGKAVCGKDVTFIDDPWRPGAIGSSLFDAEGVPTRRKVLIENGVLREYFHDSYTAHKEGVASNGSAGRSSFKGVPGPGSSNFYLQPGSFTRDGLLRDTADGILVLEIMGMHTADPVSGEFSVGVSGIAIEKGEPAGGVRGAMLSGNLLEMLSRVDGVADDLIFYGSLAAPTFRVADMTVA